MKIKFTKTHPDAIEPMKMHAQDACFDLYVADIISTATPGMFGYDTGIAVDIPEGWCFKVYPRSSVKDTGLMLTNSVGIIDSGYKNSIKVFFTRVEGHPYPYQPGERCAQMMLERVEPCELEEVASVGDFVNHSNRGFGGYGSTGRK